MNSTRIWGTFVCLVALAAAARADEAISLFDGKTLEGWDGNPKFWSVKDDAITGTTTADNPTNGNTFLIWKKGELKDFELSLKFRIEGGNSGIQFRSKDKGEWRVGGAGHATGVRQDVDGARSVPRLGPPREVTEP